MVAIREIDEHSRSRNRCASSFGLSVEARSYDEARRASEQRDDHADRVAFAIIGMSGLVFLSGIAAAAWVAWLYMR